jgi:hypothetical protein
MRSVAHKDGIELMQKSPFLGLFIARFEGDLCELSPTAGICKCNAAFYCPKSKALKLKFIPF